MERDRDYVFKASSAQGDLATLPNLIDAALDAKAKVIVTLQDATLQVAVKRVKDTPIVFHILSDPFAAGAGTSDSSPPSQRDRRLFARVRRSRAGAAGRADQADRPQGQARRGALQPGRAAVGGPQGPPHQRGQEGRHQRRRGADATPRATRPRRPTSLIGKKVDAIEIYGNAAHGGFESIIKIAKERRSGLLAFALRDHERRDGGALS